MMAAKDHRRKKEFVNKKIQGKLLVRLAVYWIVYHVMLWHAMFLYRFMYYRGEVLAGGRSLSFSQLYSQFVETHFSLIVCAVLVFPVILWDMLKLSHKVAGPLVRFQHALRQLGRGEYVERISLRKGDLLTDYQDAFNEFLDQTQQREKPATATGDDAASVCETEGERLIEQLREINQQTELYLEADEEEALADDQHMLTAATDDAESSLD